MEQLATVNRISRSSGDIACRNINDLTLIACRADADHAFGRTALTGKCAISNTIDRACCFCSRRAIG